MEGSVGAELSGNERSFGVVVCVCVPLCAEEFSSSLEGSTRSQTSAGLLMDMQITCVVSILVARYSSHRLQASMKA